jgi:hypothetical protein
LLRRETARDKADGLGGEQVSIGRPEVLPCPPPKVPGPAPSKIPPCAVLKASREREEAIRIEMKREAVYKEPCARYNTT